MSDGAYPKHVACASAWAQHGFIEPGTQHTPANPRRAHIALSRHNGEFVGHHSFELCELGGKPVGWLHSTGTAGPTSFIKSE